MIVDPWVPTIAKMIIWRGRARKAEIQRDKLLRRCARADRSIGAHKRAYSYIVERWRHQVSLIIQNRACVEDAEAALRRWKRGMNAKDTQQIIDDALAFLGAMEGRKP